MPNDTQFEITFRVPPYIMYETLTNPTELTKLTQTTAKFDKIIGGEFDLYNGYITGINEELIENKKIVQKWKFSNWKDYCEVIYIFKDRSGSECHILVKFKNVPERDTSGNIVDLKELEKGFRASIFQKINDYLGYPISNDKIDSDSESD
jgi:activator of HSP90 ATPase